MAVCVGSVDGGRRQRVGGIAQAEGGEDAAFEVGAQVAVDDPLDDQVEQQVVGVAVAEPGAEGRGVPGGEADAQQLVAGPALVDGAEVGHQPVEVVVQPAGVVEQVAYGDRHAGERVSCTDLLGQQALHGVVEAQPVLGDELKDDPAGMRAVAKRGKGKESGIA